MVALRNRNNPPNAQRDKAVTGTLMLAFLAACAPMLAQTDQGTITLTTKSGDVISNAVVTKVEADKLTYLYSDGSGGGVVRLTDLPVHLQARFGYTADGAENAALLRPPVQPTEADRKFFEKTKAKAEKGDAKAQCLLAKCYYIGSGVTEDKVEGAKWFRKAAEQGFAEAQCELGHCYYVGAGVTQDDVESAKWYRKAAEQGFAEAQCKLGKCYYLGQGVTADNVEALRWYRKAAAQGFAKAEALANLIEPNALTQAPASASASSNRPDLETLSLTTNRMQPNWANRITITNKSGVVSDAEPIRVEHSKLIYRAPGGGGSVKLSDLPPDLQERFGYDPARSAADEQQEKGRRAGQAQQAQAEAARLAAAAEDEKWRKENKVMVYGKVIQKLGDKLLIDADSQFDYRNPADRSFARGTVLLLDYPKISAVVDGDVVETVSYPMGTYEYTAVSGGQRTVRRYTASLTKALINR